MLGGHLGTPHHQGTHAAISMVNVNKLTVLNAEMTPVFPNLIHGS